MKIPETIRDVVRLARCAWSARLLRDAPTFAKLLRQRTAFKSSDWTCRGPQLTVFPKVAGGRAVVLRSGTTDIVTYREALIKRYHFPSSLDPEVTTIVDMGANIGLVTLDLAHSFPSARITAVEMDLDNFAILSKNVAGLQDRVRVLHAAVWSHGRGVPLYP